MLRQVIIAFKIIMFEKTVRIHSQYDINIYICGQFLKYKKFIMKKILFLSVIAVIFAACQSKTEYTINGVVADPTFEGQQVSLSEMTENEMETLETTTITDGKFNFKGETDTPVLRFITLGENENNPRSIIMVEPGNINVTYDTDFQISGSTINNDFNDFNLKQKELTVKSRSLSEQYSAAMENDTMTDELEAELTSAYEDIANEAKSMNFDFIKANIDNQLGQFIFTGSSRMFDAEQQKEILALSSDEYKENKDVKRIIEQLEAMEAVAIGKDYIDFTMRNPKGEPISLSDYAGKGKYVFIDFWAAWCGPCISEMPNVVEAYEKYKNKGFEVVGVSLDRTEEEWLKGIKDLKMTWPQMSDLKFWESEVVALYSIQGIPHTILLDKEGKIIAKDLRGKELHDKLAELLD